MKTLISFFLVLATLNANAFDTWWHAECTRKAMSANGFSDDARLATQVSNYITDFMSAVFDKGNEVLEENGLKQLRLTGGDDSYTYLHFDGVLSEKDMELYWKLLFKNTVTTLKRYSNSTDAEPGFRQIIMFNILGASLHAVQDFYSHSNWVNHFYDENPGSIPIWFDIEAGERKKLDIFSGVYPDGSVPGHKNHSELNKDISAIALNKIAVETAGKASIDWVKKLMDSCDISWHELKSYNIQKNTTMKQFLVTLDATFLTSSSIVFGHFDGKKPAKYIFASKRVIEVEQALAKTALSTVVSQYGIYLGLSENKYHLPTPYWAGFKGYFITRGIATGLPLKFTTYNPVQNFKPTKKP